MKTSYIDSVLIGLISLLTCAAQATCIDVNSLPGDANAVFVISQPGSYCLGDNVTGVAGKNGIRIDADNVTLDLAGFALLGVGGSSLNATNFDIVPGNTNANVESPGSNFVLDRPWANFRH